MIYFVGAGPGDKELITLKGARLLSRADCVIYAGSLVNPELLELAPVGCEIHDSSAMTLEEVFAVIRRCEQNGKTTVRLHTGDPSLYGAIREQIDLLLENDIQFEIVPGVSSFCAAAAVLGAEYTLPGVSQTVILTRMAGRTPVPEREDIAKLAALGASMAIFLSAGNLPELSKRLLEGGCDAETPAAIVCRASWPDEIVAETTVAGLAETGERFGVKKTALVLVGGFLAKGDSGRAYERSRLYDPGFTHGYRNGKDDNA